jgi:type VI secretion system protein ImpG
VTDELLSYYERELIYLHRLGGEFAEKYPHLASRLMLEPERCEDPHVERLLEGFAFIAARIHLKIDDDFPEITEALFNTLLPHFTRPIPSMSIVEFQLDPRRGKLTTGFPVPRHSLLYSRPVDGVPCKFQTCYETTLWPVRVSQAQWRAPERLDPSLRAPEAVAACQLMLTCNADVNLAGLDLHSLRFYLNGESNLIHSLYELLFNNCAGIVLRDPDNPSKAPLRLPSSALRPIGFDDSEAVLEYSQRSFTGYRVLQEYFAFPEKFFFVELTGLEKLAAAGFGTRAEIIFLISRYERSDRHQTLEQGIAPQTFRLNCTPIINLFPHTAEPIHIDQTRYEYPVIPDARRRDAFEVFSVEQVLSSNPSSQEIVYFDPLYSWRHAQSAKSAAFWQVGRRPSTRKNDDGVEVWISLSDLDGRTARPGVETLTVRCNCTNRDLVSRLPFASEDGAFTLEGYPMIKRIASLRKPTATLRPAMGKGQLWRLVSHLSLNYLSLVEDGRQALQELLHLYNYTNSTHLERQIGAILNLKSAKHFARIVSDYGINFARGTKVEIELDEEQFEGGGAYLFGSVLEYFLGQYVTLNSFSQLVLRTKQRKEVLREWPPRAGHKILL